MSNAAGVTNGTAKEAKTSRKLRTGRMVTFIWEAGFCWLQG